MAKSPIGEHGYDIMSNPIEKPALDTREYALIRLHSNDLQVLLVSDQQACKERAIYQNNGVNDAPFEQAGVALDVAVGHMSDPDDMPGLAHFCEHLSFMGTTPHPSENEYKRYIKLHGGLTNASTSSSNTTYHFKVQVPNDEADIGSLSKGPQQVTGTQGDVLESAIERFAAFFYAPLFRADCVSREVNAVNSEGSKNQQMDSRRLYQLWKHSSDPTHPWRKFGCGSRETLLSSRQESDDVDTTDEFKGQEARRRVMDWWENHYCASRMKVAIVGPQPIQRLIDLTLSNFSHIPNRGLGSPLSVSTPPWSGDGGPRLYYVRTVKDTQRLEIRFPIPYQEPLYMTKPTRLLSHIVGHEGPGSILHFLHTHALATSLSAGLHAPGRGFSLFGLDVVLTRRGLFEYKKVLSVIFHYLTMVLPRVINERHHFDEVRRVAQLKFDYAEPYAPDTFAKSLAQAMNNSYLQRSHIVSHGVREWELDKSAVQDVLECLVPQRASVFVAARNFKGIEAELDDERWETEPWYGAEFQRGELAVNALPVLSEEEAKDLFLPGPNPYLPDTLDVHKSSATPLTAPSVIRETTLANVWFKKDDQFWRPRGSVSIKIQSPALSNSLAQYVQSIAYIELVLDALQSPAYAAELAGLGYSVSLSKEAIYLTVSGYNDKLFELLKLVLGQITSVDVQDTRMNVILERLRRAYDNAYIKQSGEVSDTFLAYGISEKLYTAPEIRKELDYVDVPAIEMHRKRLLEKLKLTMLVHGNIERQVALDWSAQIETSFKARSVSISECNPNRILLLPEGCNYALSGSVPNPKEPNCAISYYCHAGWMTDGQTRALVALLGTMLNEPFFHIMRTQEQLGYSVSCVPWANTVSTGLRFRVQSTRHPDYLETRIDAFIDSYLRTLCDMSQEQFGRHKKGVVEKMRKRLVNLGEEQSRFWSHIDKNDLRFDQAEQDAQRIEELDLPTVIRFYEHYIHPSSMTRRKLSVRLTAQTGDCAGAGDISAIPHGVPLTYFADVQTLRANLMLSPASNSNLSGLLSGI